MFTSTTTLDLGKIGDFPLQANKIVIKNKKKKSLAIPKELIIDGSFLRSLYTLVGDGSFCKGVYMCNTNYRIHKDFINMLYKTFKINKEDLVISLTVNNQFTESEYVNASLYWTKALDLKDIPRFYVTPFNTLNCGSVKVIYDSINLSVLVKGIVYKINSMVHNNQFSKKQLCYILDGILNAEGSASIDQKRWGLHKITISFNNYNKEEKLLFSKILSNLDLSKTVEISQKNRFKVSRWYNQYLFLKVFVGTDVMPFSLSPKRAIKLLWGFLNHHRTKSISKYLKAISKGNIQTFKGINQYLNYDKSSISYALRKFNKFNFFIVDRLKRPFKVSLTEEGKSFLMLLRKLDKWLLKAENMYMKDLELSKEVGMEENLLPFERIQRKVLMKIEAETSWDCGEDPNKRSIERLIDYGVINLNKHSGPTSHQVSDYVKKILGLDKVGHSGTLEITI